MKWTTWLSIYGCNVIGFFLMFKTEFYIGFPSLVIFVTISYALIDNEIDKAYIRGIKEATLERRPTTRRRIKR